jgi:UDP-N-acetylmuramate--alanine ligase
LIGCGDDANVRALMEAYGGRTISYGFDRDNDVRATDVEPSGTGSRFLLHAPDTEAVEVLLQVPGRHNILNAMGAVSAANVLGLSWEEAAAAIVAFSGTGRRLELVGEGGGIRVYDDYAHHPTEIRATLQAVRESLCPNRLIAVFQPHLYSRTQQFLDEFAQAFEAADLALFMDIYGAREEPMEGVSGQLLAERAEDLRPDATTEYVGGHAYTVNRVLSLAAPGDVVVCLGAGDITKTAREIGAKIAEGDG